MLPDEPLELGDDLVVPAAGEIGVDPLLERREAKLLQPADVPDQRRPERHVAQGLTAPEGERLPQPLGPFDRLERTGGLDETLEPQQVDGLVVHDEPVARRPRLERVRAEELAQPRDGVLKRGRRGARRVFAPERRDQRLRRDDVISAQEQERERASLLLAPEDERLSVGGQRFEWSEEPVDDHCLCLSSFPP